MRKPILCLDFDGVCHLYTSGWKGAKNIPDGPVDGLFQFLDEALDKFDIAIYSSRSHQYGGREAMMEWFCKHAPYGYAHLPHMLKFPTEKPSAMVTLDDRGMLFTGVWPSMEALLAFKPWNK